MTSNARHTIACIITDWLSTSAAVLLFNIVRYFHLVVGIHSFANLSNYLLTPAVLAGQIVMPIGMVCIYALTGYYNNVLLRSRMAVLTNTLKCALLGTLAVLLGILINDMLPDRATDYGLLAVLAGLLFIIVYIPRYFITRHINSLLSRGVISFPTIIIGYSSEPQLFTEQVRKISPMRGTRPVMFCDAENQSGRLRDAGLSLPTADLRRISDLCNRLGAERLILIPHPTSWEKTLSVINQLMVLDKNIFVAAESLPPYLFNTRLPNLVAEPFIDVSRSHMSYATLNTKRAFDVAVSSLMLIITGIPVLCLAAAVKLTSDGPAFFKQKRVGLHRRHFTIYKLRTMYTGAERDRRPELSHIGDMRVTPLGRVLRKYHIDELPQFWNVLRGDMSIVGPRPERSYFIEQIMEREPAYTLLLRVRPGITSLGMVKFGYATTVDEMLRRMRYDLLYIQNISLTNDLKVLLYTAHNVFSGKGV